MQLSLYLIAHAEVSSEYRGPFVRQQLDFDPTRLSWVAQNQPLMGA